MGNLQGLHVERGLGFRSGRGSKHGLGLGLGLRLELGLGFGTSVGVKDMRPLSLRFASIVLVGCGDVAPKILFFDLKDLQSELGLGSVPISTASCPEKDLSADSLP